MMLVGYVEIYDYINNYFVIVIMDIVDGKYKVKDFVGRNRKR